MTHRAFSRNAASSRAIPIEKMMKRIFSEMATPERWGINGKGMQDHGEASKTRRFFAKLVWRLAGYSALFFVWLLSKLKIHKQIANRISEPFSHITVIITADQFGLANMFAQRDHKDAQPEFRVLARKMWVAYNLSNPTVLKNGEWHLPYITRIDRDEVFNHWYDGPVTPAQAIEILKKISVGRCARVSYLNHDGVRHLKDDLKLCERLMSSNPGHWSPFEHVAQAITVPAASGNIRGFRQYRKDFENEFINALTTWNPLDYEDELDEFHHVPKGD